MYTNNIIITDSLLSPQGSPPLGGALSPQGSPPLGGALSPQGSPPLGGALSPQGSPPLGGALSPQGKKRNYINKLTLLLTFFTYLLCLVVLDCDIFLCETWKGLICN